jgi:hypothetical protein
MYGINEGKGSQCQLLPKLYADQDSKFSKGSLNYLSSCSLLTTRLGCTNMHQATVLVIFEVTIHMDRGELSSFHVSNEMGVV